MSLAAAKSQPRMLGSNLIAVVNEVHDALSELDIRSDLDLPQIAVVGSQSSGKSSVLESVVGRDFLPRGSGIVTRCPLVLKLQQEAADSPEWGEFEHKKGVKFDDFSKIRQEIEARTQQVAGGSSISSTPISLTVHSPKVLNLTLIDLPGIVSTAIGDQPKDIERQIKEMVLNFIRPENTIILAVTPANADLANSVALKAARSVDPEFNRTIGVLTKLDLMDHGTNAVAILENRVLPLKRGWIGVVNRSQKAINENQTMTDAKESERMYFLNSPDYRAMAERMGTDYLAQTMSTILLQHIQRCMPALRARIDDLVKKTRARQEELGMLDETDDKASKLLNLLHSYTRDVQSAISGDSASLSGKPGGNDELQGGARLHYILYEAFARHVQGMRAGPQLTKEKLRYVIRNSSGIQASFFPSNAAFLTLVREQIARLEDPALMCIQYVHEELRKICAACAGKLHRYPQLNEKVIAIAHQLIDELRAPCTQHMKTWVQAETKHINTRNPALLQLARAGASTTEAALQQQQQQYGSPNGAAQPQHHGQPQHGQPQHGQPQHGQQQGQQQQQQHQAGAQAAALARAAATAANTNQMARFELPTRITLDGDLTPHEAAEHAALREIVEGYFSICKDTLCDQNPKIIAFLLVQKLEDSINAALMKSLFKEDLFDDLLTEAPQIAQMRKATTRMMTRLLKAQNALDRVRDMPAAYRWCMSPKAVAPPLATFFVAPPERYLLGTLLSLRRPSAAQHCASCAVAVRHTPLSHAPPSLTMPAVRCMADRFGFAQSVFVTHCCLNCESISDEKK
eukprot:CAMPEP_0174843930 /NCGR_PEP_ID=MMETSP1114-20130205/10813_1 /TAXON_ID=312471 /ORGANISM="Neobodo designis, Strain CCAP 1951/1" /LENGTH=800 /DNA_ID=CAMNT_0016078161 /DNA_START=55 /DNA_END=2455 /DNA_ORIENTATION=+